MFTSSRRSVRFLMMILSICFGALAGFSQTASQGKTGQSNPDSVNDVITTSFSSNSDLASTEVQADLQSIQGRQQVKWFSDSSRYTDLQKLVDKWLGKDAAYSKICKIADQNQIYIFHLTRWASTGTNDQLRMTSSGWYAYKFSKKEFLKFSGFSGTGDQLIYGKSKALIIGISEFDDKTTPQTINDLTEQFQTTVIQGTPENIQNLGQLVASVGGITPKFVPQAIPIRISVGYQAGTSKLPFTLTVNVTDSFKSNTESSVKGKSDSAAQPAPSSGTATCSANGNQTPCSMQHSFVSEDREWWDISIGITIPGTHETKYAFSNGAVQTSVTRHTDLYGMFDIFPAAKWLPKESYVPHFVVGLPVTSRSLYRPYFGLAENLTGWTRLQKKLGIPVGVNFFAGEVYMKINVLTGSPTTQAEFNSDLKQTRVWKTVFGIEVPISSIASKIGGKKGG